MGDGSLAGEQAAGEIAIDSPLGRLVVAVTVLGSAVAMMTATVVNVALPSIARDLDASSAEQQWVSNAYLLTLASLILVGGSLGDKFGRVRIYRLGVIGFASASFLCAIAPSIEVLIGARLIQGAAAALTPGELGDHRGITAPRGPGSRHRPLVGTRGGRGRSRRPSWSFW